MLTESSLASAWAMSQSAIGTRQCLRPRERGPGAIEMTLGVT